MLTTKAPQYQLSLQNYGGTCANGDGGDAFARLDYEDSDGDIPIITLIDSGYWDFRELVAYQLILVLTQMKMTCNCSSGGGDSGNTYLYYRVSQNY